MPRSPQYLRWTARRRSDWLRAAALGLAALAVGLYLGYAWFFPPPPAVQPIRPPNAAEDNRPAGGMAAAGQPGSPPASPARVPRIGPGTQIVYRILYRETGQVVEETLPPTRDMVDLSEEMLRRFYPQYRVEEFTEDRVVLTGTMDGPDPKTLATELAEYRTLRTTDGVIGVFAGRRHRDGQPLLQRTNIRVDALPASVRARLQEGIEVRGDEEVARYMEGLTE